MDMCDIKIHRQGHNGRPREIWECFKLEILMTNNDGAQSHKIIDKTWGMHASGIL